MGVRLVPKTSETQRDLEAAVSKYLLGKIGTGAQAYLGQLTADIPEMFTEAYKTYGDWMKGDIGTAMEGAMEGLISGRPSYVFDPLATAERWRETYASPMMESWRENVLPSIREGFNLPGVLYSRGRGEGVASEASKFYGQYVAPSLYSSLQAGERMGFESAEAAAARQPGALGLPGQMFGQAAGVAGALQAQQQAELSAAYNEFLRTRAEPGWAVQSAIGYMTQPTFDALYKSGGSKTPWGTVAGAVLGGLTGGYLLTGAPLGGFTMGGALAGGLAGSLFDR